MEGPSKPPVRQVGVKSDLHDTPTIAALKQELDRQIDRTLASDKGAPWPDTIRAVLIDDGNVSAKYEVPSSSLMDIFKVGDPIVHRDPNGFVSVTVDRHPGAFGRVVTLKMQDGVQVAYTLSDLVMSRASTDEAAAFVREGVRLMVLQLLTTVADRAVSALNHVFHGMVNLDAEQLAQQAAEASRMKEPIPKEVVKRKVKRTNTGRRTRYVEEGS